MLAYLSIADRRTRIFRELPLTENSPVFICAGIIRIELDRPIVIGHRFLHVTLLSADIFIGEDSLSN
jgi:hypothetical protein